MVRLTFLVFLDKSFRAGFIVLNLDAKKSKSRRKAHCLLTLKQQMPEQRSFWNRVFKWFMVDYMDIDAADVAPSKFVFASVFGESN